MFKKIFSLFLTAVLTIALAGCGFKAADRQPAKPAINKKMSFQSRRKELVALQTWRVSGAISIRFQNKTEIGSFTWSQRGRGYDFRTFGPLHMAGVRIAGRPGNVKLYKGSKAPIAARSPEQLMYKQLGWSLPLSNFRYWGRAIVAPNIPAQQSVDRFGHLKVLNQQGWRIQYQHYQGVRGMDLPKTITLNNRNVKVKIVFKRWRLGVT